MNYRTMLNRALFICVLVAWSLETSASTTATEITPAGFEASSDDGNIADNAFDNDFSTRWSALGNGENLTINLGAQYNVTEVHTAWFKGDERKSLYQIQISDDATNWLTVIDNSSSGESLGLESNSIHDSGHYLRIIGLGNDSNAWNSITEIKVFGYGDVVNTAPEVNAGGDQLTTLPSDSVNLSATVTDDGIPNAYSALWSVIDGPEGVNFTDETALNTTANFSKAGIYTLRLTANDGDLSANDDLTITVTSASSTDKDSFGITKFYPTMPGYTDWESIHWNNGNSRTVGTGDRDPDDPTGWTHTRGDDELDIDGNGVMEMGGGNQPRIYINPYPGSEVSGAEQVFKNIEATVYYKRKGTDGANWGGLVMGLRSGPSGHSSKNYSADSDYCDATTYYARFRHDGRWDFEKELKHPGSASSGYNTFLPGGTLPSDQWIGMKYLAYNIENDTKVKLELYIDTTSNGDVSNGGEWVFLGEKIDDGSWVDPEVAGCSYSGDKVIVNSGGVILIRNTEVESAEYKYLSIREIDVGNASETDSFGITKFYPTMAGYTDWESTHWNNGNSRTVGTGDRDPDDPTGWTHTRGDDELEIDGNGVMEMGGGNQPRIYINPYPGKDITGADQIFKNIEATVYYKRTGSDGANWGGLIMGLRGGPSGHSSKNYSADSDYCDATTYYARFRHDGNWDFEKELKHPGSSSSGYGALFPGGIPADQWIGMKYLAYNIDNDTKVKLELWIDDTSNGDTTNGGEWRFVGEKIDDGNWVDPDVEGCSYSGDKIILNGGGVAFIRNTDVAKAEYKNFSVREIDTSNGDTSDTGEVTPVAVEITPASYSASSDDGNIADYAFDGDFSTRWSAFGSGESLLIDLGAQYNVTEIDIAWFKGDERQSNYQIQISEDALSWLTVVDSSSSGESLALESNSINDSGRYLRIIGLGNDSNGWNSITEIEIIGFAE